MDDILWLREYFDRYRESLLDEAIFGSLTKVRDLFKETSAKGGKIMLAGNGGSAGIASHVAVDLAKNAHTRAMSFSEPGMITCLANDYGYEQWMAKYFELYYGKADCLVLISSSGKSANVLMAAQAAKSVKVPVVTLSGFSPDNPLRGTGDINLWVDSRAYNIVEMTHQIWLLAVVDMIIGKAEYPAS